MHFLDDYESFKETRYLLSNEANANHLRKSLRSLKEGKLLKKSCLSDETALASKSQPQETYDDTILLDKPTKHTV
ncbi:MAG TPA: hypothetical protein VHE99_01225 [Gammaproteobacteria bacterium]|nr:hypothetical protein [Gammaproteobacteria bacterium]